MIPNATYRDSHTLDPMTDVGMTMDVRGSILVAVLTAWRAGLLAQGEHLLSTVQVRPR
jgi:biotin transporter BioY